MMTKELFEERYKALGGRIEEIKLQRAIRHNSLRIPEKEFIKRLSQKGIALKKIPFSNRAFTQRAASR
jgi:hypothetical protein